MTHEDFEKRAQLVRPYFNGHIRYDKDAIPPPFTVEFLGTPSSGKTTAIKQLDKFWKRQGFRSYHPQEGAEAVRYLDRSTYFYNVATGLYAYQLLMQVSEGHQYDFVTFDRCVFDACTWMEYWHRKGQLDTETKRQLQESFLRGAERVDVAIITVCDAQEALRRETRFELTDHVGNFTNTDTIDLLLDINKSVYEELSDRFPQLHILDTTNLNEIETVQATADIVLSALEQKVRKSAS